MPLDEDLDFGCSGLLRGSRSFTFLMVGRLGKTDFDGRLSPDLTLCPVDDALVCELVFGKDDARCLDEDDAADLLDGFFSSSVVMESTDIACASSAVDSPAAGIATSPNVIVVSALDPDVILCVRHRVNVVGRQSLRLITCVRAWYTLCRI